jgi:N6-adenosine-specific RNA methylase IME4
MNIQSELIKEALYSHNYHRPGKWLNLKQNGIKTLIRESHTDHSRKPQAMYGLIESVSYAPYFEMFARRRREGWDVYGDQVETQIQTTLIKIKVKA